MSAKESLRLLRKQKKCADAISIICGFTAVFLMGGVDSEEWVGIVLAMVAFGAMALLAGIVAKEFQTEIDKITRYEPWLR